MSVAAPTTVLHVNRVGFLGGVERVILTLGAGLRRHGFQTWLACPEGELARAAAERGIRVMRCGFVRMRATRNPFLLGLYPFRWLLGAWEVQAACEAQGVRLIHAHHPIGVLYAAAAKRRLRVPLILHVHEVLPAHRLYRLALRRAARYVDHFVCVSEAGRALITEVLAVAPDRISIIHNGVDLSFSAASSQRIPAIEAHEGPHVGVFGVIEPRKGQDVFLAAAARLAEARRDVQFWVVGPVALKDKARFAENLKRRASQANLAGRVHFVGFQVNVRDWMSAMDVVVLASVGHESLSMVLLESATLGRPTVGTNVGGGAEIITDRVTGRLVEPGDSEALARAITHLLSADGPAIGAKAAEDAKRRFGEELFCNRICALYAGVLGTATGGP